ncbi:MAG: translation elongation factor Ts [Paenibacillaceae bacterium]|jgi:elongation factor Ts|nr:translation elongation factor Ts [Paenibacillaceae bacterium]
MTISAASVKQLRERTGAGMLDCKKALEETAGDMEKAIDVLRQKGLAAAQNKAGRIATEGLVYSYIHGGGRIGVLLEVNCETDFVGKLAAFREFVHDVALQIAATNPQYVSRLEVSEEHLSRERDVLRAQALAEGKPAAIVEKMIEGRMGKFYEEACLLEQPFVKRPEVTIEMLVNEKIAAIGEKIAIRRFVRYALGEGMEKKQENFAEEVLAQVKR